MRPHPWILPVALVLTLVAGVTVAAPIQQGSSIVAIQLSEGRADLAQPLSGGFLTSFPGALNDVGVQIQFWHFLREDYAFNLSGGIGFMSEKDESNAGNPDIKYSQPSWQLRIGGDRVAHITPNFHIFAGPGIEYWSGKWKLEQSGTPSLEGPTTNRFALSGRIGVHLKMGESFGLYGQIGDYIGRAWATDGDSKVGWWASGHEGGGGIAFNF